MFLAESANKSIIQKLKPKVGSRSRPIWQTVQSRFSKFSLLFTSPGAEFFLKKILLLDPALRMNQRKSGDKIKGQQILNL